jgi:hypothetical protein
MDRFKASVIQDTREVQSLRTRVFKTILESAPSKIRKAR